MKKEKKIYYVVIGSSHSYKSNPFADIKEAEKLAGILSINFDPQFVTVEDQYGMIVIDFAL